MTLSTGKYCGLYSVNYDAPMNWYESSIWCMIIWLVLCDGQQSDLFDISSQVKQGCVPAVFFAQVLEYLRKGLKRSIYIHYHVNSSAPDLRYLTTTKTFMGLVIEAIFMDYCSFMAHDKNDLQVVLDISLSATKLFELMISLWKTENFFQK